jgi:hypothetical protein
VDSRHTPKLYFRLWAIAEAEFKISLHFGVDCSESPTGSSVIFNLRKGEETMMRSIAMAMTLIMALLVTTITPGQAQEVKRMTVEKLRERLAEPNLVVIDVRSGSDWTGSKEMIKGARREEPGKLDWAAKYTPGQILVLYCT